MLSCSRITYRFGKGCCIGVAPRWQMRKIVLHSSDCTFTSYVFSPRWYHDTYCSVFCTSGLYMHMHWRTFNVQKSKGKGVGWHLTSPVSGTLLAWEGAKHWWTCLWTGTHWPACHQITGSSSYRMFLISTPSARRGSWWGHFLDLHQLLAIQESNASPPLAGGRERGGKKDHPG